MLGVILAASQACIPTAQAYEALSKRHGESRIVAALSSRGTFLEVWASSSGSWSALVTRPDGLSCIVDAGQGVTTFAITPAGDPA